MSIKGELLKIKSQLLKKNYVSNNPLNLNEKIEEFLDWYLNNGIDSLIKNIYDYQNMKDIIDKWATWYENKYSNKIIDNHLRPDINYNTEEFIEELTPYEKFILSDYSYPSVIYIDLKSGDTGHFHVDENGIITEFDRLYNCNMNKAMNNNDDYTNGKLYFIIGDLFVGKTVEQGYELLKRMNYIPDDIEYKKTINEKQRHYYLQNEFLDAIMYRIIDRGGNGYGPRRGLLFAKEFNRNIETPMMYGLNPYDLDLESFIDEYIKLGGRTDLECVYDYFFNRDRSEYKTIILDKFLEDYNKKVLKK